MDLSTSSLEMQDSQLVKYGTTGGGCRSRHIYEIRDNRDFTYPKQAVPVEFLYNSGDKQTSSDSRLSITEQIHPMSTFQDGGCSSFTRTNRTERLDLQNRFKGRVCSCTDSREFSAIPNFPKQRNCLPVPITCFWSQCGAPCILKTDEICDRTFTQTRNPVSLLPGRHLSIGTIQERDGGDLLEGDTSFGTARFHHQLSEEHSRTIPFTRIPWVLIQYQDHADTSADQKNPKTQDKDYSDTTIDQPEILPMDCEFTGKNHINDSSHRRSTSTYSLSSKRFGKMSESFSQQLGSQMQVEYTEHGRTVLVDIMDRTEERSSHPERSNRNTNHDHICRRFRQWMGNSLSSSANMRFLDTVRTKNINQCKRTADDSICNSTTRRKIPRIDNKNIFRQSHCIKIRKEVRRNSKRESTRISSTSSRPVQQIQLEYPVSPHTGDSEQECRQAQPSKDSTLRMDITDKMVQVSAEEVGKKQNEDRCFCSTPQSSITDLLEPATGSTSKCTRCFPTRMAVEGSLPKSALETNSSSDKEISTSPSRRGSVGDSTVAVPVLVGNDKKIENDKTNNRNENQPSMDFDRMVLIDKKRSQDGITEAAREFITYSTRNSTNKSYDYGWRVYTNWCEKNNKDPRDYNPQLTLEFLIQHNHLSSQYLNVIRSAIVSVYNVLHPEQMPLSQQPLITEFFKAKRKLTVKVPEQHEQEIWDIQLLTDRVKTWGENDQLPLQLLQQKTLILLGIATMWRPRSDLGRLQHRDINFQFQNKVLSGATLVSRQPKEAQHKTSKIGVTSNENSTVCPVRTLFYFMEKTKHLRSKLPENHTLFLAYIFDASATKSVLPSTVANWVRKNMEEVGIDIRKYKAHSLRSAASTFAVQQGNSIQKIKQHANWSTRSDTFEKFYYKPFNSHSESSKISDSIFSPTENITTTSECDTKATTIVLRRTNNQAVAEVNNEDVVVARPQSSLSWLRNLFS